MIAARKKMAQVVLRWESFFEELESFLRSSNRYLTGDTASESCAHSVIERFGLVMASIVHIINVFNGARPADQELLEVWSEYLLTLQQLLDRCRSLTSQWEAYIESIYRNPFPDRYCAPIIRQPHARGRPPFQISQDQLSYLASLSFTWTEIAELLGVSRMTIYRRRHDFNMLDSASNRNTLTDLELRELIRSWKSEMPAIGETLVIGRLHACGHYMPREKVRCAIHDVDPLNTALRSPHGLTRRQCYSVPAPNSLWHIGEYLKCDECMHAE